MMQIIEKVTKELEKLGLTMETVETYTWSMHR